MTPRLPLILILLLLWAAPAAADSTRQSLQETFLRGNIAYGNGNYAEAEAAYRAVLQKVHSPEVHFNLGNALAQQDKWSEAAFHYMRAYALNPNFEAARGNLLLAASRMGLARDYPEMAAPARYLPERSWSWIAAISFWIALIAFFYRDFTRVRVPLARTAGTIALLVLAVSILAIVQHNLFKDWAVVSAPLVSLRVAPTEQSPGQSVLIKGDPVRILGEQKGFFHVMTVSGAEGFILLDEAHSLRRD